MSKMNIEVMEQLLKDLAANVGYDLIPSPFDTPFEEASVEDLPDSKQFFWTMPASVLNSKEQEEFRKMCIEADIIDTVCTTSLSWPTDENERMAILLIDVTRRRRGSVKFVNASAWNILEETDMAAVCNLLIHDMFPGEDHLAFQMNPDAMDEGLDDRWNEQVRIVASCNIGSSLLPQDYLPKPIAKEGFKYVRLDKVFSIEDCKGANISQHLADTFSQKGIESFNDFIVRDNIMELKVPAIIVSAYGNLQPQKVVPEATPISVDLTKKIVLIPLSYSPNLDLDYLLEQLGKESTIRQLPFLANPNIPLKEESIKGILIEIPEQK